MTRDEMPRWADLTPKQQRLFDWVTLEYGETIENWWEVWCDACAADHTDPLDMEVVVS